MASGPQPLPYPPCRSGDGRRFLRLPTVARRWPRTSPLPRTARAVGWVASGSVAVLTLLIAYLSLWCWVSWPKRLAAVSNGDGHGVSVGPASPAVMQTIDQCCPRSPARVLRLLGGDPGLTPVRVTKEAARIVSNHEPGDDRRVRRHPQQPQRVMRPRANVTFIAGAAALADARTATADQPTHARSSAVMPASCTSRHPAGLRPHRAHRGGRPAGCPAPPEHNVSCHGVGDAGGAHLAIVSSMGSGPTARLLAGPGGGAHRRDHRSSSTPRGAVTPLSPGDWLAPGGAGRGSLGELAERDRRRARRTGTTKPRPGYLMARAWVCLPRSDAVSGRRARPRLRTAIEGRRITQGGAVTTPVSPDQPSRTPRVARPPRRCCPSGSRDEKRRVIAGV